LAQDFCSNDASNMRAMQHKLASDRLPCSGRQPRNSGMSALLVGRRASIWIRALIFAAATPALAIHLRSSGPTQAPATKGAERCSEQVTWLLPPESAVTALYGEVQPLSGEGHAEFQALRTSFGTLGALRDDHGRLYASFLAPGLAADVKLSASGAGVDVTRTAKLLAPNSTLAFHGMHAVLELDADDSRLEGGALSTPLSFLLRLTPDAEAAQQFWKGWPRSFAYRLEGYVRSPTRNVWRLLADVNGRVVLGGKRSHSGFLTDLTSGVLPLDAQGRELNRAAINCAQSGRDSESGPTFAQHSGAVEIGAAHFGPVWYQQAGKGEWLQLTQISKLGHSGSVSSLAVGDIPAVLREYPKPDGDNSPAGLPALGLRHLGPQGAERLSTWGQFHNASRVFSCVTPDLAAIMADPLQYVPPPKVAPNLSAQGFCQPMLAEHFWWAPPTGVEQIEWFYNEITVEKSAPFSYFMANGFAGGYFGIQEHGDGRRFALFSVWDAGSQVEIVDWGENVTVGRFGAEGTGANSHLEFPWQVDEAVRFLVHAEVEESSSPKLAPATLYSGYIHMPSLGVWRLMSKLRVRPCGGSALSGGYLTGLNSFLEVFQPLPQRPFCDAYGVERRARYGTPWYRSRGMSSFQPLAKVALSATCPPSGCPRTGLNFEAKTSGDSAAYVLHVGSSVTNAGLPLMQPRPIPSFGPEPAVLSRSPLPDLDSSPAGDWSAGQRRPLRGFGASERMTRWGSRAGGAVNCPWYVASCGKTGGAR